MPAAPDGSAIVPAASGVGAAPLDAAEFARLMAGFAPFEQAPALAVAVSGGPDSLALLRLAAAWAEAAGGRATALTVDHGLRPAASAEAGFVADVAARLGVAHHVLAWTGPKPEANLAAEARAARYALLEHWCDAAGVLHLLTAHTRDDQAETVLLRLARGSGVSGLAAMAPVVHLGAVRLLRPLLDVPKDRLLATLAAAGQDWVDDPTNRDLAFARARIRAARPALVEAGLAADRLADTARVMARARAALHADVARLLAEAAAVAAEGAAVIRPAAFLAAPREIGLRALSRVVAAVGGLDYPPRAGRLEALLDALAQPGGWRARTLGGCRLVAASGRAKGRILVHREAAALPLPTQVMTDGRYRWDRFTLDLAGVPPSGAEVGALGGSGWIEVRRSGARLPASLAGAVARALPAVRAGGRLLAVPSLGWVGEGGETLRAAARFEPPTALMR